MEQLSLLPELPRVEQGFVYYATDLHNIKIGHTLRAPMTRGGELHAQILVEIPGNEWEERRHQRMWRHYRIPGTEWFRPGNELMLWVTAHMATNARNAAVMRSVILNAKGAAA